MSKLNQTLLKFELQQNFAYDDFFVSKCNYFAFSLIETWPKWEKNILNIYGEKFSGKSHLSEIFFTSAPKPIDVPLSLWEIILSKPANAPPQINNIFVVSTCKNSC